MSTSPKNPKDILNTYFSAGLSRSGRIASWMVAIVGAGVWMYYDDQKKKLNHSGSGITKFSKQDQEEWNKKIKMTTPTTTTTTASTTTTTENSPK